MGKRSYYTHDYVYVHTYTHIFLSASVYVFFLFSSIYGGAWERACSHVTGRMKGRLVLTTSKLRTQNVGTNILTHSDRLFINCINGQLASTCIFLLRHTQICNARAYAHTLTHTATLTRVRTHILLPHHTHKHIHAHEDIYLLRELQWKTKILIEM